MNNNIEKKLLKDDWALSETALSLAERCTELLEQIY